MKPWRARPRHPEVAKTTKDLGGDDRGHRRIESGEAEVRGLR
jgi:hypothetical protein